MVPPLPEGLPPNVLILSHPRSGSSWLGATLANSRFVDYRREPVLQARIGQVSDAFGASPGLADRERLGLIGEIERAFSDRASPVVVVKEVTPLLVDDFVRIVDPKVIYLRRHPVAVAQSHIALGWLPRLSLIDRSGIGANEREVLQTVWASGSDTTKLVAYFGAVESSVRDTLDGIGAISVNYEDLSAGDLGDAAPLLEGFGLDAGDLRAPALDAERTDAYGVGESRQATSAGALDPGVLEEARRAWLAFNPVSYTTPAAWPPNPD